MAHSTVLDTHANLPVPPTRLVGREADVAAVVALMDDPATRLVTLIGPGGVGKTHLSLDVAALLAERHQRVAFIPLATVIEPDQVLPGIAAALGLHEASVTTHQELLREALAGGSTLLLLDNLEQVIGAAAEIGELLAGIPNLRILATSRAPLRLRAEREYPVAPLALPVGTPAAAELAGNPAVALFVERARAVRPAFALTDANAGPMAEIARRLDGLPLAIELAAALTRLLSPEAMLARLDDRLPLLVDGAADLPPRQRTLRSAIAWSDALLAEDERAVFRRMAVIAGGASLDAIAAVCPELPPPALLGIVAALLRQSLLRIAGEPDATVGGGPRVRMLAVIREYGLEQLEASGEADATWRRLLDWLVALAERADRQLTGPEQVEWLARLDDEHASIRAALGWALAHDHERGLRLASALWRYWATHGRLIEGHTWLDRHLAAAQDAPPPLRARAFGSLGNLALDLGDYEAADTAFAQALRGWETLGDEAGIANILNGQGLVDWYRGDYAAARRRHEESLARRRRIGDRHGEANSLSNLGNAIKDAGDPGAARAYHEHALAIRRELGHRVGVAYSLLNLADVARRLGDADEARATFAQCLAEFERAGDTLGVGYARQGLGLAAMLAGDPDAAGPHFAAALEIRAELGDRRGIAESVEGLGSVAARHGDTALATTLFGAAHALRERIGAAMPAPDRRVYDPFIAGLRRSLPARLFAARWDEGRALSMAETVTLARSAATAAAGALSQREIEVLGLVAAGLTNAQVAERLFLSRRTVDAHMRRIYDKLDLSSRDDAIRYARERGLA